MNTKLKVSDQFGTISVDLTRKLDPQESALLIQFATALVAGNTILPLGIVTNSTIPQEYRINFNGTASNKIQAIKLVREFTGMGLKEAKDIVEGTIKCPALSHEKVTALSKELIHYGINEFIVQSMPMVPLAG